MYSFLYKKNASYYFSVFFILSIPFFDLPKTLVSGLSFSFFIAIPLVFVFIMSKSIRIPYGPVLIYFIFVAVYSFSLLINSSNVSDKGLNHLLYYIVSFLLYYVVFYFVLDKYGFLFVSKFVFYGLLVLAFVGTLEVFSYFILGFDSYAEFLNHGSNIGIFAGLMPRMRSLFNEPSHLAIYVISIAPMVWGYNKFAKYVLIYVLIFTFSTSAAIAVLLSVSFYLLYKFLFSMRPFYIVLFSFFILIVIVSFESLSGTALFFKLFNVLSDNSTDGIRKLAFLKSMDYVGLSPFFGLGPAFYYNYSELGLFNLYLQIYIESGFFGLGALVLFFVYHAKGINSNWVLYVSYFAVLFQYVGMNHYYIPGIWMLLAFSFYVNKNKILLT